MAEINWAKFVEEAIGGTVLEALPPTLTLPALPHAVTQFMELANKPDADIRKLAGVVETDTGLTLELLRHVNSSYIGLRNKARGVLQAITLLGLRQSKMFLVTVGLKAAVQSRQSKLINQASFWNATLQKALFAKLVAGLLKTDQELAFSAALLQDYLLPVLTNDLSDHYMDFIEARNGTEMNLTDYERSHFGWDHALTGACLAHRWKLPDELVACILFHHHGLKLLAHPQLGRSPAAAVALSALLPDQLRQVSKGLEQLVMLQTKWAAFDMEALAKSVDDQHSQLGAGVQNDFPLSRRLRPILDRAVACAK
jgi:HD-like signal output (HDOD) protein